MTRVGRAVEKGETQGFMKVIVDAETDKILGAAIFGVGGDEVVHEILDIMSAGGALHHAVTHDAHPPDRQRIGADDASADEAPALADTAAPGDQLPSHTPPNRGMRPNQWRWRYEMTELPPRPRELRWPTSSSRTMSSALGASTPKYSAAGWSSSPEG